MLYYSVRFFLLRSVYDYACVNLAEAKALVEAFYPGKAIVRSSTTSPIPEGFTNYTDFGHIHYVLSCGCEFSVAKNGRIHIDEDCKTEDCCNPHLCAVNPNFFTVETFVYLHGRKIPVV